MKEQILDRQLILDDYFKVEKWFYQYKKEDGTLTPPVDRLMLKRADAAAVIIFNIETQKVLLIKQFRHCTYDKGPGWIVEAVAGVIEQGEAYEEAVKREAIEEVGYRLHSIEKVATFYTSPGYTTERMFVCYAEVTNADKIATGGGVEEESEYIVTVEYSLDELNAAIQNDELNDSKTIIAANYLLKMHGF